MKITTGNNFVSYYRKTAIRCRRHIFQKSFRKTVSAWQKSCFSYQKSIIRDWNFVYRNRQEKLQIFRGSLWYVIFFMFYKNKCLTKGLLSLFHTMFLFLSETKFECKFWWLEIAYPQFFDFGRHFRPFFPEKYFLKIHRFIYGFVWNTKYISNLYLDASLIF